MVIKFLQSKQLKRSCQGWINEFINGNFISFFASIFYSWSEYFNVQTATRFKSRMLVGLLSGFTRQTRGNLAKIWSFCSSFAFFFTPLNNTKREARDFSALERHKNTPGGRESGKKVVHPVFVFMQIRDILLREARHYEIKIFVLNRVAVWTLK